VQERLARAHGSQCGFCTPGFVMSMYSLLRSKTEAPTEEEIEENLAGNLWCAAGTCSPYLRQHPAFIACRSLFSAAGRFYSPCRLPCAAVWQLKQHYNIIDSSHLC